LSSSSSLTPLHTPPSPFPMEFVKDHCDCEITRVAMTVARREEEEEEEDKEEDEEED